jgi:hypothetical protein
MESITSCVGWQHEAASFRRRQGLRGLREQVHRPGHNMLRRLHRLGAIRGIAKPASMPTPAPSATSSPVLCQNSA